MSRRVTASLLAVALFAGGVGLGWLMRGPSSEALPVGDNPDPKSAARDGSRPSSYSELPTRDLLARTLELVDDPLGPITGNASPEQLRELLTDLAASPGLWDWGSEEANAAKVLLKELARREGAGAWDWVMSFESYRLRRKLSEGILLGLAESAPDLALQLYQDYYAAMGGRWGYEAGVVLLESAARKGVDEVLALYRTFPRLGETRIGMSIEFPEGFDFVRWLEEAPVFIGGDSAPDLSIHGLIRSWARQDPDAALAYALSGSHAGGAAYSYAPLNDILEEQMAQLGEADALEWLAQAFDREPAMRERERIGKLAEYYAREPALLDGIANAVPAGEVRRELLLASSLNRYRIQPETALRYMEAIPAGPERRTFLDDFLERAVASKPNANASLLTSETFATLEEGFQRWGLPAEQIDAIRSELGVIDVPPPSE